MHNVDEKRERFKRIAENRTNKILEQMRLLGNCSNKNNYAYTEEEIRKIFTVIENQLKETKQKFLLKSNKEKFRL